jgi:TIR domain
MKKISPIKYDAFISYADPDIDLAQDLNELFEAAGLKTFFAPKNLPKMSAQNWEKDILENALKKSRCFVPIFTRESLKRRWVLFESGAAAASKLAFFVTHVDGIEASDVNLFPYMHNKIYCKLHRRDDLQQLVLNVAQLKYRESSDLVEQTQRVDKLFNGHNVLVEKILCKARRRWVFIAGNTPKVTSKAGVMPAKDIPNFVRLLSAQLMESGFNLSACPQVTAVGKVVLKTAQKRIADGKTCSTTGCEADCEIAGIYPIDRVLSLTGVSSKRIMERWSGLLLQFRQTYLSNKEWVVIIGGNKGSEEEFHTVCKLNQSRDLGIRVCLITCFGGVSRDLKNSVDFNSAKELYFDGCAGWKQAQGYIQLVENVVNLMRLPTGS